MNTIPDRQTLSSLRRADLQKLCKERGLRANMRSGELIDLLLDIAHGEEIRRPPSRASSMRVVSRAGSTSSTRSRAGSIIVHDLIEEPAHDGQPVSEPMLSDTGIETTKSAQAGPSTRRKAKETQFKLGVGRPAVIGGTGARAPSSSTSKPRSTRGRTAVIAQPSEVAIQEEDEEPATSTDPLKESSTTPMELDSRTQSVLSVAPVAVSSSSEEFRAYVATVLEPLKAQIGALQADLERAKRDAEDVHSLRSSISELTSQLATLQGRDQDKTRLLESLREELAALKLAHVSEDAYLSSDNIASESHRPEMAESNQTNPSHPTQSSLGKRRRGMDDSVLASAGIVSSSKAGTTSGHATTARVSHSSRKKAKLDPPQDQVMEESQIGTEDVEDSEENNVENSERAPRPFTIFSGPEERSELQAFADGPPSTVRLSEMFAFPAVTPPNGTTPSVPTSTAHGPENRGPSTGNAFSFNFATSIFRPMTSTPAVRPIAALPPPEPPTSPSPAGPGVSALSYPPGSRSRPGSRPTSRAAQTQVQLGVTAPAAPIAGPSTAQVVSDGPPASTSVIQTPSLAAVVEETSSNAEGAMYANPMRVGSLGVGLPGIVPLPMPPDTPDQPMKRTMYGTELEGDSRFGDFGVEGVAMGFWTGAAPRF